MKFKSVSYFFYNNKVQGIKQIYIHSSYAPLLKEICNTSFAIATTKFISNTNIFFSVDLPYPVDITT